MTKRSALLTEIHKAFANSERFNASTMWLLLQEYILPNQFIPVDVGISGARYSKGQKNTINLYDSSAVKANVDLASFAHNALTNNSIKWAKLRYTVDLLNNNADAVEWLQLATDTLHNHLNRSNFTNEIGSGYRLLTALGNMILFCGEKRINGKFQGIYFQSWHPSELAWGEDEYGQVTRVYRRTRKTASQLLSQYPDTVPETVKKAAEKDPDVEFTIFYCIKPNDSDNVRIDPVTGLAAAKNRPYISYTIMDAPETVLEQDGHYEMPVMVTRWDKIPGEVYGRGPGHIALPDIRTLNKVVEEYLKSLAMAVRPPLVTTPGNIFGSFQLRPGQLGTVADPNAFREFTTSARFDVGQVATEVLRNSIRSAFFIDKLMLPPRTETGEMSAYEVSRRVEDMQKVLSPTVGRLHVELLDPLVKRVFGTLLRNRQIPPPPDVVLQEGAELAIEYVNSLSLSQRMEDVTNIQAWVQELAVLSQVSPEAMDYVDVDAVAVYVAKVRGVPEIVIRNEDAVVALREARSQAQAQEQQLDAGVRAADIAAKLSKANRVGA